MGEKQASAKKATVAKYGQSHASINQRLPNDRTSEAQIIAVKN
jgi:hypothetical protein